MYATIAVGDRIKLLELLSNPDSSIIPVEDIPVGTRGTVTSVALDVGQIGVAWDNGSRLCLLTPLDDGRWEKVLEEN